jgi:RNA polymerase sigma-70 factor, ECF subfamily
VLDEKELLRRIARGDRDAFDEFYTRTAPWLTVRLRGRCSDDDMVAEALQETFLAVWRAAGSFVGSDASRGGSMGWLWAIAVRRLVDVARRRGRATRVDEAAASLPDPHVPAAEETALDAAIGDPMWSALRELAPELREVLQAMVLDGLTVRETSMLLGVPEGTVKTRARRARIALREAMS